MKSGHKKGTHLSLEERVEIYKLKEQGFSIRRIGRKIGRNHSVVSRELSRNSKPFSNEGYKPVKAHTLSKQRTKMQRQQAPLKNPAVFLYVREKLRIKWTPEQIAGRLPIDHPGESISYETIYQYIYGLGRRDTLWHYLVRGHKKRKPKKTGAETKKASKIKGVESIEHRPTKANNRKQAGHRETDLMESPRGIGASVSAHIERKTRFIKLEKLENKKAATKQKSMQKTLKKIQSVSESRDPIIKSMTYDNGSENTQHQELAKNMHKGLCVLSLPFLGKKDLLKT
ncbi:IS30 family transposase [Candidatus Woesebacteria bacterium]|nr:IS30 family transposase [Candidatus Woesebacteria bacterium]